MHLVPSGRSIICSSLVGPTGRRRGGAALAAVALLAVACGSAGSKSATTTSNPPTTASSPSTTMRSTDRVPASFSPLSVTFVSAQQGFVLGAVPCDRAAATANGPCPSLATTADAGRSWTALPAPPTAVSAGAGVDGSATPTNAVGHLRFGDHLNGWAYGPGLWATHDGGVTWTSATLDGTVTDLASADGVTYALVSHCDPGPCGQGATLYRTDAGTDAWTAVEGVVLTPTGGQISLHGRAVWINAGRSQTGHNQLSTSADGVTWTTQPDPCEADASLAGVAPSTTTDLFLLCNGSAGAGSAPKQVLRSSDAGHTVQPVAGSPSPSGIATSIAAASPQVVAIAASSGASWIYRSADGGATWTTALEDGDGGAGFTDLGFTTATQGVAIHGQLDHQTASGTQLLMTTDAGAIWVPVTVG